MKKSSNTMRRIVTGHSKEGKSIVVSDTTVDGFTLGGGKNFIKLWGNDKVPVHPNDGTMQENKDWFPQTGGHRFFVWEVPPKSENAVPPKSKEEVEELLPGFLKHFEPENPGMHTSDSVDCTYLISGSVFLELDDQKEIEMHKGDSVVQNGTRHRWHNRSNVPAVFITTAIGSERK